MTSITLNIADDLAAHLSIDPTALPALLRETIAAKTSKAEMLTDSNGSHPPPYQEIIEFLSSGPTTAQVLAFKISPEAQGRLEELLYRNCEAELTETERDELNTYLHFSEYLTRLKARAQRPAADPLIQQPLKLCDGCEKPDLSALTSLFEKQKMQAEEIQ